MRSGTRSSVPSQVAGSPRRGRGHAPRGRPWRPLQSAEERRRKKSRGGEERRARGRGEGSVAQTRKRKSEERNAGHCPCSSGGAPCEPVEGSEARRGGRAHRGELPGEPVGRSSQWLKPRTVSVRPEHRRAHHNDESEEMRGRRPAGGGNPGRGDGPPGSAQEGAACKHADGRVPAMCSPYIAYFPLFFVMVQLVVEVEGVAVGVLFVTVVGSAAV